MKTRYILLAITALALSACAINPEPSEPEGVEMTFTAYQEGAAPTKSTVQNGGTQVYWEPSDEIKVFFGGASGRFLSQNTENVTATTFTGSISVVAGANEGGNANYLTWGLYPYRSDATCDGSSVTTTLPAAQTGRAGSFAKSTNITLAQSGGLNLPFYNVCGGVRFSLTQEGIKRVTFEGNNGEALAGKIKIAFEDGLPVVQEVVEADTVLTLTTPGGGTFQTGVWYYISAIPGTLSGGYKMVFYKESESAKLVSTSSVRIKRGIFGSLADADEDLMFKPTGDNPDPEDIIQFEDPVAKYACVEKFDTDGDGEVSYAEAASVSTLSGLFTDWNTVTSFDEIQYFTGVTSTSGVFTGLSKLTHITIPDNITTLGTFQNCSALETISLPSTISSLPNYCFDGCSSLKSVTLPTDLSSIPNYCFRGCVTLTTLAVPSTLTSVGQYAFSGCIAMSEIDLPIGIEAIGGYSFQDCVSLETIVLPESLTTLGQNSFSGCGSLSTAVLPSNITSIPNGFFNGCSSLKAITWPLALQSIGNNAFYGCVMWQDELCESKLELPASVKSIGSKAFQGVHHLIIPSTSSVTIASDSFIDGFTLLYVPSEMVEIYKVRTNWSSYENQIYPISDYPVSNEVEAVDLGLSVKWASCNLGASSPNESGDYYAWGELFPKSYFSWSSYKWSKGSEKTMIKYCNKPSWGYNGFTDNKTVLDAEDDAASVALGEYWHIPTRAEWEELISNCTWSLTWFNGAQGIKVTSNIPGYTDKWIFLPRTGLEPSTGIYYLSSSLHTNNPSCGYQLEYNVVSQNPMISGGFRRYGNSLRPVYGVRVHPNSIVLNKSELSLSVGGTATLTASVIPSNSAEDYVIWESSDASTVSVDEYGNVTGISAGTAEITVTTVDGGYDAKCMVVVNNYDPNTPDIIDLGLPSGIKWASFNLGATSPEENGTYFGWGETEPKNNYHWSTYKWSNNGDYPELTKYCNDSSYGYCGFTDNKTTLDPDDDAAFVALGDPWRIPSKEEWTELEEYCTWTRTTLNGVNGYYVSSTQPGYEDRWIFLPDAGSRNGTNFNFYSGQYWSSSLNSENPSNAYVMNFKYLGSSDRFNGFSIRPVCE